MESDKVREVKVDEDKSDEGKSTNLNDFRFESPDFIWIRLILFVFIQSIKNSKKF